MLLELDNVHVYYGKSHVINGVNLGVGEDQCIGLVGRNGAGKTTLLKSIMGLLPIKSGSVTFQGAEVQGVGPRGISKAGVAIVPQGRHVFSSLSVIDNLLVSHIDRGSWNVDRVFELFPKLKTMRKRRAGNLSGGEQQMLAIGRGLVTNPKLMMMDEPSEGLAPAIVRVVAEAISQIKGEGMSILLAEQNLPMVCGIAERVLVMSTGEIVWEGSAQELMQDEETKATHLGFSKVATVASKESRGALSDVK